MGSVCLNMIVRNEVGVIQRCLNSVKGLIDYWVIVDTGSVDGSQEIIRECLGQIPGELYERPWIDFAYHRNEALELSRGKGDYFLFIDADDQLVGAVPFLKKSLDRHYYAVDYRKGFCMTKRILLADGRLDWKWRGRVHEVLQSTQAETIGFLPNVFIQAGKEGFRSRDPDTLKKDLALLKQVLEEGEDRARTLFHLAVFSEEAGELSSALDYFQQRASMGGWDQEVFYSLFRIAALQESLGLAPEVFILGYERAYAYRPSRAEPLAALAFYCMKKKDYASAYPLLKKASLIPLPQDTIYVMHPLYEYEVLFAFAEVAYELGKFEETWQAYKKLLSSVALPLETRALLEKKSFYVLAKISHKKARTNVHKDRLLEDSIFTEVNGYLWKKRTV